MFYNFNLMPVFRIMECIQVLVLEKTCLEYSVLGLVPDVVDDSLHNPTNYAEYQLDLAKHNNLSLHNAAILSAYEGVFIFKCVNSFSNSLRHLFQ